MDKTPGKPNPMVPSGATDPLEEVQGKKKPGHPSDTKVSPRSHPISGPPSSPISPPSVTCATEHNHDRTQLTGQEYGTHPGPEETDVGEPGELAGSEAEHRHVSTGLPADSELVDILQRMKRNEEPK